MSTPLSVAHIDCLCCNSFDADMLVNSVYILAKTPSLQMGVGEGSVVRGQEWEAQRQKLTYTILYFYVNFLCCR